MLAHKQVLARLLQPWAELRIKENDTESGTSREKESKDSKEPKEPKGSRKKIGARKGHPGARQEFITPDEELKFFPGPVPVAVRKSKIWSLSTSTSISRSLLFW